MREVVEALAGAGRPVCAYVYSLDALRARAAATRDALPPGATLLYAMKANGHPDVVSTLARAADGIEVASGGELAVALAAGARRIAFGGPAKTDAELVDALAAPVPLTLHVESAQELRRLARLGVHDRVRVALRVNRATAGPVGTHAMTGAPTPFGIEEAQLPAAVELARQLGVRVAGFHLHAVSNSLDAREYARFTANAMAWSIAAALALDVDLEYVNVGGGLGISYLSPDAGLPLDELDWSALRRPAGVELAFEPGRFLAADAGWYAAEVLDLKRAHGTWFAVVRGGTHHFRLPAAWGYDHPFTVVPVEEWPYPWPRPVLEDARVTAAGELCTPRDVLCRDQPIDRVRVGDILVFGRAGAYGWDISHHEYLRHPHPQVIVV